MIGKMYELVKARMTETMVFDENFKVIDSMKQGDSFVVIEYLSNHDIDQYGRIHKLKLLTPKGRTGYSTFWDDEIELAKTP